jgi:hypothetical protein
MFCVIQELQTKRTNKDGFSKSIEAYTAYEHGRIVNRYRYSTEKFKRPTKNAYKISIHESQRVNGVIVKKQWYIATIDYYDLAVESWRNITNNWLDDENTICDRLHKCGFDLGIDSVMIWNVINEKIEPLQGKIISDFQKTDEYKTHAKNNKIIRMHEKKQWEFRKENFCTNFDYDVCFNVFGNLTNRDYFVELQYRADGKRKEPRHQQKQYYEAHETHENIEPANVAPSDFTDVQKSNIKRYLMTLTRKYHPDVGGNEEAMKAINDMKHFFKI